MTCLGQATFESDLSKGQGGNQVFFKSLISDIFDQVSAVKSHLPRQMQKSHELEKKNNRNSDKAFLHSTVEKHN